MVTIRSLSGMKLLRQFSIVVLPLPVPPETSTLQRAMTAASRNFAAVGVSDFFATRSETCRRRKGNLRIVRQGPLMASGGITALTRLPSFKRASTSGCDLSIRRPTRETIRSMIASVTSSETNCRPDFSKRPFFSI